jgi:hypothetical protein
VQVKGVRVNVSESYQLNNTIKMTNFSSKTMCDFISKLPDPILHHILGLLKTKKAVQTCVLSKRWKHLWTSLPSLDFSYIDFDDFDDDSDDDCERFVNFVNALLLRRKPLDLDVFHLSCYELPNSAQRDWIRYAINHNVRVLHLSPSKFIPWSTYTCTSLKKLYLYCPHRDLASSVRSVNLPNLKKLSIYYADLNSNYVKNFLSGCPKLKFLRVDACNFTDCIISHEYLKYLVLVKCQIKEELFVSAPNLLVFSYEGEFSLPCKTTLNMPSLAQSRLTSSDPPYLFQKKTCDPSMIKCFEGMATCLRFLTNVELLELHFECRQYKVCTSYSHLANNANFNFFKS